MSDLDITPLDITVPQVKHCLALYPKVVEKHYASKTKDPKKVSEAIERDKWRYEDLPRSLRIKNEQSKPMDMSLAELARLVQWKITHGQSRPFLPAMIRKNQPEEVVKTTNGVAELLARLTSSIEEGIAGKKALPATKEILDGTLNALDKASKLSGVGPATASLVLSVCDAANMPFFEDEMFNWMCSDLAQAKLKYNKKEYSELVKCVWELRRRLRMKVTPVDIEKTSFVLEHWDLVDEKDQSAMPGVNDVLAENDKDVAKKGAAMYSAIDRDNPKDAGENPIHEEEPAKKPETGKRGTKRGPAKPEPKAEQKEESDTGTRRSKRVK